MSLNNKFKKIVASFLLIFVSFSFIVAPFAHAQEPPVAAGQGTWWMPRYQDFIDKVNGGSESEIFGERYTHAQVAWIIHSLLNIIVGPLAYCSQNEPDDIGGCLTRLLNRGADQGALIPLAMIGDQLINTKPASGVDYVAGKLERLDLVQDANAQSTGVVADSGFGFVQSLGLVQPIWVAVRDAAYALVIFAIIILAFMVMLRAKLSPNTVVTIQSALPRVALGLILITFSYAIAGFMVDLVFVFHGLTGGVFESLSNKNAAELFAQMQDGFGSMMAFMISFLIAMFFSFSGAAIGVGSGGVASFFTGRAFAGVFIMIGVIVLLIVVIVTLIAALRVTWILLRTYVVVLALTLVSPFLMLVGIIKGSTISMWFKAMVANLAIFYIVPVMIMISHLILYMTNKALLDSALASLFNIVTSGSQDAFGFAAADEIAGVGSFPGGFGFGSTDIVGVLVSMAFFLSIPSLANGVRDYIQTGRGQLGFDLSGPAAVAGAAAGLGGIANTPRRLQREADISAATKSYIEHGTPISGAVKKDMMLGELMRRIPTPGGGRR